MHSSYLIHTFGVFVVPCDVLESGKANSFGADEAAHPLRVFAVAEHLTLPHYDGVDISVHLGADEGTVVNQVDALILDGFDRCWAAAEHSWGGERRRK